MTRRRPDDGYERRKERERFRQADLSRSGRDISEMVRPPADPERKARATASLKFFCEEYLPQTFRLRWSEDHLKVIAKLEEAVGSGGLFAMACSRGFGKTALSIAACLWAALAGKHSFITLVAANEDAAKELLEACKVELETNDLLDADFSEVTGPVRALEGIVNRCSGQLHGTQRTHVRWTSKTIVLPVVPGSPASGVVIRVAGLLGRIRGMQFKHPDGRTIRPSLALIDDPQSDESALSPEQCAKRERVLSGAILGLAGPGKKISGVLPCTVVVPGDMADRILDPALHPEWNGTRAKLVYQFPERMDLWEKYADLRRASFRAHRRGEEATAFYAQHRAEMDRGSAISWPERFNPDELSALQHAMNLRIDLGEDVFQAEYQNEPKRPEGEDVATLTAEQIQAKTNRIPRNVLPVWTEHLTCAIDVHDAALVWACSAWAGDFTGAVVAYGVYPEQRRRDWNLKKTSPTLSDMAPGTGKEGAIRAGLDRLADMLLAKDWHREDGVPLRITLCLVDHGYLPDVIFEFARRSPHRAVILPSRGFGVGAKGKPMAEYPQREGETFGWNYLVRAATGRAGRHLVYDSNHWKSTLHARLAVALGDRGCLSLYGDRADEHELFARHLTAERPKQVSVGSRAVWEWEVRLGCENHYLDVATMCAVAACHLGAMVPEAAAVLPKPKSRQVSYADMQRAAHARSGMGQAVITPERLQQIAEGR
jgi:Phage terminase large subunit (GpA)